MALTQKSRVTDNAMGIFIQNQLIRNNTSNNFTRFSPPVNDEIKIRMIDPQISPGGGL